MQLPAADPPPPPAADSPSGGARRLRPVRRQRSFATPRAVMALALREMQTTYGRSPGGYLWLVLEPVAGIALLSLIFSIGFRSPALGSDFAPFYATGMVPFLFYSDISGKIAAALLFSRQLLAYPSVTFVDAILARFLVNVLSQLLVAYVVFGGILMLYDMQGGLDLEKIALAFAMTISLGTGVGIMNCYLATRFPLWQRVWAILNRPMFLISCIFFLFESIPQPYRDILWYNPLVHIVGMMRAGFYSGYGAEYVSVVYVMGLSLGLGAMGMVLLRRFHRLLLDR